MVCLEHVSAERNVRNMACIRVGEVVSRQPAGAVLKRQHVEQRGTDEGRDRGDERQNEAYVLAVGGYVAEAEEGGELDGGCGQGRDHGRLEGGEAEALDDLA